MVQNTGRHPSFFTCVLITLIALCLVCCIKTVHDSDTQPQAFTLGVRHYDIKNALTVTNLRYQGKTFSAIVLLQSEILAENSAEGVGCVFLFEGSPKEGTYDLVYDPQQPLGHSPMFFVSRFHTNDFVNDGLEKILDNADVYVGCRGSFTLRKDQDRFTIMTSEVQVMNMKDQTSVISSSVGFEDTMLSLVISSAGDDTGNYSIFRVNLKDSPAASELAISEFNFSDSSGKELISFAPDHPTKDFYVAVPQLAVGTYWIIARSNGKPYVAKVSFDKTTEAGEYYEMSVNMATLGDLMGEDGMFYDGAASVAKSGTTAIGIIAYLGADPFSENGTKVGGTPFVGHGLVLCLVNAARGARWTNVGDVEEFPGQKVDSGSEMLRTWNVSGYTYTSELAAIDPSEGNYDVPRRAWNFNDLKAPAGTTGWFLPSAQQWARMLSGPGGLGGLDLESIESSFMRWIDNEHQSIERWENALKKAGTGNYHSILPYEEYWSSSEYDIEKAIALVIDGSGQGDTSGILFGVVDKGSWIPILRTVLAF